MLISSWIINELRQILANFRRKKSLFDICVYTDISESFSLHEYKIRYDMLVLSKTEEIM